MREKEQGMFMLDICQIADGCSPNVKKDRKKFGLRKKKSSKGSAADLTGCSPNKATQCEIDASSPGAVSSLTCSQVP